MSVIMATPHIDSYERHYVPSPHRPSASMRGDTSTPYGHTYPQKHGAQRSEHRTQPEHSNSRHPIEHSGDPARAREAARTHGETRQSEQYIRRQPPTPPWLRRPSQYAFAPGAPLPNLADGTRSASANVPRGLNGAFSGAWSSARPAPTHTSTPTESAWTQTRESSDSGMDADDDATASDHSRSQQAEGAFRLPPLVSDKPPCLTLGDILFGSTTRDARQSTSAAQQPRERAGSWESDDVRLPPIRPHATKRPSVDYSPYGYGHPPAKRACVQLPSLPDFLPEFIQGSSSAQSGEGSHAGDRRSTSHGPRGNSNEPRGRSSEPPSPSPSVGSLSSSAHSDGQTDTEPTEDEDAPMGEAKRYGSFPSLLESHLRAAPAPTPASISVLGRQPASPPRAVVEHGYGPVPTSFSTDAFLRVPPQEPQPQKRKGKGARPDSNKPRRRARARAESTAPPQRQFRFVASHLSGDVLPRPELTEESERSQSPDPQSAERRRKDSSSPDIPLAATTPSTSARIPPSALGPSAAPPTQKQRSQSRAATEAPKRRGRPPRPAYLDESLAPIDPDSPEGQGQFPIYSCNAQPTRCHFLGCKAILTGTKTETTSHLKHHFQKARGRMVRCPWEVVNEGGETVPCGKTFKDPANMGRHISTKHMRSEVYKCGRCFREFARRDASLRHMKTMCSPEKEQRRAARRKVETDTESDDAESGEGKDGSSNE